jgi:hypothetical protein
MEEKLQVFQQTELQTKDGILFSLRALYKDYELDDPGSRAKKELLAEFITKLEGLEIPDCADWWFYSFDFTRFGIELTMSHCVEFTIETEGNCSLTVNETLLVTDLKCGMITVSDFAAIHGVQPVTVRQWIRRGKLRMIQKTGRDWLISAIAEKPSRAYIPVMYKWDTLDPEIYQEFPMLKGLHTIEITQNPHDKSFYTALLDGQKCMVISPSERERLEIALLSRDHVQINEDFLYPLSVEDQTKSDVNKEKTALDFVYGPVIVLSGRHKGRIGSYQDTERGSNGKDKAIVYFGDLFYTMRYQYIPFEALSDQITTPAIVKRMDEIPREIWGNFDNLAFQNDRLTELCFCKGLLADRYMQAMGKMHMKQGHKVFISHAGCDLHLARAIATDLLNDGFSVFLDDWSIDLGENIISRITEEIDDSQSLIMLLSEDYLKSTFCNDEWTSFYIRFSKKNPKSIYPILLNDAEPPALLSAVKYARIREIDDYQDIYLQLIKAIKKRCGEI